MTGSTKRNVGLVRVLSLLRLMEGRRRYTLDELAKHFNVTTRTIRRDFVALQEVGYAIGHDERGDEGAHSGFRGTSGTWWLASARSRSTEAA